MDYVPGGTTCTGKADFARRLRDWLDSDHEAVIGEPSSFAGKPLIRVDVGGELFHLNGDSRDEGVEEYLRLVQDHGEELPWNIIKNQRGSKVNAVAFGEPPEPIKYFYLYASENRSAPHTV